MVRQALRKLIQHHYFIPLCLTMSIIVRVLWVWLVDAEPISDFNWYYQRALEIADGEGYSVDGTPTAYWSVGYPGFLAVGFLIFGDTLLFAKLSNIVLYLATIFLTYFFSKRLFHNEYAARITLFILAFYPNHIAYTSLVATEILFTFLLALGALLFIIGQEGIGLLLLSGISWGLGALVKPQAIFVPIIFLLVFYTNLKSLLKKGIIIYLMLFLTLIPWLSRNRIVLGKPVFSTNVGINLLIGNSPYSDGLYMWNQKLESLLEDEDNEIDRDVKARQIAIDFMVNNPIRTIALWPNKLIYLYLHDVEGISWNHKSMPQPLRNNVEYCFFALKIIAQSYYLLTILLFIASLPFILRKRRIYWIGLMLILYFTLISLIFFGSTRFHFPLIPWVAIYSGIGGAIVLKQHVLQT